MEDIKPEPKEKELTNYLILLTLVTGLGASQCGFNLWLVNDPATLKQYFKNLTRVVESDHRDEDVHPAVLIFTVASFLLGCLFGSLFYSPLADKCGRKVALLVNDVISIVSTIFLAISKSVHAHGVYIMARLLTGISTGIFSCAIPMYLGELSPVNLRGGLATMSMMFIHIGMLMSQILGGCELLGTKKGVPFLLSIPGIMSLFQFFLLLPFPESPRYLLIQKRDEEGARQDLQAWGVLQRAPCNPQPLRTAVLTAALQKLRGKDDVENEIEDLRQEDLYEQKEKDMTIFKLLCSSYLRWQLVCVVTLFIAQQFCGFNSAYYYSEKIYLSLKIKEKNIRYVSALITFLDLFVQAFSIYVMDSYGRRPLLLIGIGICIITSVLITMSLELQAVIAWMPYVSCFLCFVIITGITLGPNSIPHLMIMELFLQSSRASAYAVGGFVQWFFVFLIGFTYGLIAKHIGSYIFLIFLPFSVAGFFYILKVVPETKKKTFLDIRRHLEIYLATRALEKKPTTKKKSERHVTSRLPSRIYGSLPHAWQPRRSVM